MKEQPVVKCYVDNQEVINRINMPQLMNHKTKYLPISEEANTLIQKVKSKIVWIWVKSHQSNNTLHSLLNNKADAISQKCRQSSKPIPKWPYLLNDKGVIFHNELPIMDNSSILSADSADHLLFYFSEKWNVPQKLLYLIDWISFQIAFKKLSEGEKYKSQNLVQTGFPIIVE